MTRWRFAQENGKEGESPISKDVLSLNGISNNAIADAASHFYRRIGDAISSSCSRLRGILMDIQMNKGGYAAMNVNRADLTLAAVVHNEIDPTAFVGVWMHQTS